MRDRADEAARAAYDPSIFEPQRQQAAQQATQGLPTERVRQGALASIFRSAQPGQLALFGGDQSRAIGGMTAMDAGRATAMADAETQIGLADEQARLEGQGQLAEILGQQREIAGRRDAAIASNQAMLEAERSRRRGALATGAMNLGLAAFGPAIGAGIAGLFVGDEAEAAVGEVVDDTLPFADMSSVSFAPQSQDNMFGISARDVMSTPSDAISTASEVSPEFTGLSTDEESLLGAVSTSADLFGMTQDAQTGTDALGDAFAGLSEEEMNRRYVSMQQEHNQIYQDRFMRSPAGIGMTLGRTLSGNLEEGDPTLAYSLGQAVRSPITRVQEEARLWSDFAELAPEAARQDLDRLRSRMNVYSSAARAVGNIFGLDDFVAGVRGQEQPQRDDFVDIPDVTSEQTSSVPQSNIGTIQQSLVQTQQQMPAGFGVEEVVPDTPFDLFRPLIDETESAGDYSALLGFSNRGVFGDIDVTQMTLSELDDFSRQEYGPWSRAFKQETGIGNPNLASTPMGRYQFVNTTLQEEARRIGLDPDTTYFTPEIQDQIFESYITRRLSNAPTIEAKRRELRNAWEGFANVPDDVLDRTIMRFERLGE